MAITRLLVVDDLPLQLQRMRTFLEPAGYEVICAQHSVDAQRLAEECAPDLILLEVLMPDIDGYSICSWLKENPSTRRIPIIFVTVDDDPDCETRCFALGAADFIAKPICPPVMLARIRAHLAQAAQSRGLREIVQGVIEFAPDALILSDTKDRVVQLNTSVEQLTGYQKAEFYREMWATLARTGSWQGKGGAVIHYEGTPNDITERKNAAERIHALAFYDPLTGLPNRTLLLDRLKQALTASQRSGDYGALLFIDLDHFKNLNDTLGHDVGDVLLQQVGQRLSACVRAGDTVARLGGDEFVVVLAGLSTQEAEAASGTELVAGKVLASLNQAYNLGSASYHSTASIGATLFSGTQLPIEVLMKHADLTMYKAKAGGRNTVRFFDPAMEIAVRARTAVEADLRQAVARQDFVLHYQPQVTTGGHITGVEALIRWQHPVRGIVPPSEFIALAEETGLIVPLGMWVLESACRQLALWTSDQQMPHLTMAVNVSAHQFRQLDFVDQVLRVLQTTGARPERLKLELTESLLVDNVAAVVETMTALKAKGIGFSLDDFGTGYSSLAYLKRLPLDQLKIDKSFVHDLLLNASDAAIAGTIVALAQSLGMSVIAEGVETAEQRDVLSARGCDAYQGYLFSRPLASQQFETLMQTSQQDRVN